MVRGCLTTLGTALILISLNATGWTKKENNVASADPMQRRRDVYLELVKNARAEGFRPLPAGDALVDRALFASMSWRGRVFRVPIREEGMSYHVASSKARIDLLKHTIQVDEDTAVEIYEASSFFLAFVPTARLQTIDPVEQAAAAARLILKLDAPVSFQPVPSDPTGKALSTDPDRSAGRLGEWKRRIDAVPSGAWMVLVIYKATLDDMMTLMSNPGKWFEELRDAASHPGK